MGTIVPNARYWKTSVRPNTILAMRRLRFALVLALACAMPMQGIAAVMAGLCAPVQHAHGHDHQHDGEEPTQSHCCSCEACCVVAVPTAQAFALQPSPTGQPPVLSQPQPPGLR